jgi:hypothetical protein
MSRADKTGPLKNDSNHNSEFFGAGWKWHTLLALAAFSLACAAIMDKQFAQRWLSPDGPINNTALAQLTLFRYGLCALTGLLTAIWLLRNAISRDWCVAGCRWQCLPTQLFASDLLPKVNPRTVRSVLAVLAPAWIVGLTFSLLIDDTWANSLTRENGSLETGTVILYCASGILFSIQSILYFRRDALRGFHRWWLVLLALFCFVVAGEETNWGQNYLDYDTPGLFKQLNVQEDFSLHNIRIPKGMMRDYWANDFSQWLSILAGVVLPALLLTIPYFRHLIWALDVPLPPWLAQAYLFIAAVIPPDYVLMGQMTRANIPSELREFTIAVAFGIWAWSARSQA